VRIDHDITGTDQIENDVASNETTGEPGGRVASKGSEAATACDIPTAEGHSMRVVSSADWRDAIPFETPIIVAEVAPGEPTRCFVCGSSSELRDRSEIWVVKHRHPKNHSGFVRFYCTDHRPVAAPPAPPAELRSVRSAAARERRIPTPRRDPVVEKPREMCPNCFVEVSAKGECGMCGWTTA
jgi:hypothetical protein